MKPIIFTALLLLTTVHFGRLDVISQVKDLSAALATASGPCVDLLKELNKVAALTATMLKLTGPIGSLIATSVKIGFPEESKEFKAITLLNNSMNNRFDQMDVHVQKAAEKIAALTLDLAYLENVQMVIVGIKPYFIYILDPHGCCAEADWKTFTNYCNSQRSKPMYGINYINQMMAKCEPYEENTVEKIAILLHSLGEFEQRATTHGEIGSMEWTNTKIALIKSFMKMEASSFGRRVQRLKDELHNSNFSSLFELTEKVEKHIPLHLSSDDCILTTTALKNDFRRSALFAHVRMIKEDLLTLSIMAGVCTNTSTSDVQQRDLVTLTTITKDIFKKLEAWLNAALTKTWPKLTEEHVRQLLHRSTEIVGPGEMATVALKIRQLSNEMGLQRYSHRVLIVEDIELDGGRWSFIENCSEANCVVLRAVRGVHVVITRFDFEQDTNRAQRANEWFSRNKDEISNAIINWHASNKDLPTVFSEVNWALHNQLSNFSLYRNFVLIRREKWLSSSCLIDTANSTVPIRGTHPTENMATALINPFLFDAYCYALFLFL
ncbi:hypothetical protein niasHT_029663 [Heterodera trifolii]|uniref:Uncharacterized protein n=1 Tax=Heterodera trifolii TaxID=157864 RepID=A0ABD2K1M1_9BILA